MKMHFRLNTTSLTTLAVSGFVLSYGPMAQAATITLGNDEHVPVYANELNYDKGDGGTPITFNNTVSVPLGFGVSAGQERYIRFLLSPNASFQAAFDNNSLVDTTTAGNGTTGFGANTALNDGTTIVNGGNGQRCVVYQVTGLAPEGNGPLDNLTWTLPNTLSVTDNASVTLQYSIHGNATSASCDNLGTPLSDTQLLSTPKSGNLIIQRPSLVFDGKNETTVTASVAKEYKQAVPGNGTSATTLQLGTLTPAVVKNNFAGDGLQVENTDLFSAATILISGDFSAAAEAENVYLTAGGNLCSGDPEKVLNTNTALNPTKQTATITGSGVAGLWTLEPGTPVNICYKVNGTTAIKAQEYTASVTFTPAVGATLAPLDDQEAGKIVRDGTVLRVPYINQTTGQVSFVQLANHGAIAAVPAVSCLTWGGTVSPSAPTTDLTVPAGATRLFTTAQLGCPSSKTNAIELTLNVPRGQVNAMIVQRHQSTGTVGIDGAIGNTLDDGGIE